MILSGSETNFQRGRKSQESDPVTPETTETKRRRPAYPYGHKYDGPIIFRIAVEQTLVPVRPPEKISGPEPRNFHSHLGGTFGDRKEIGKLFQKLYYSIFSEH